MRKLVAILAIMLSSALYAQEYALPTLEVEDITKSVNFGHEEKLRPDSIIDIIVVHSNYFLGTDPHDVDGCISQFRKHKVAPHYLITREGTILKMVDESHTAFHAGTSLLPGTKRTSLNKNSIGIEIINTSKESPSDEQYDALLLLTEDICIRHNIRYIVRHSDIAPDRKDDPWMFDWEWFSEEIYNLFPSNPLQSSTPSETNGIIILDNESW